MKKTTVKKAFLVLSLMLLVATGTVWAGSDPAVNEEVKASFKKEFTGSELIKWTEIGEYFKATFILNDHRAEAYFSQDGQLVGSIRSLFYNRLPLVIMTTVNKRFPKADILEVNEISNASGTTYQISLELNNKKYQVKLDANGFFKEIEKQKK